MNESTVVQADIIGEGGVIHGINKVILPGTFTGCGDLAKGAKKGFKKGSNKATDESEDTSSKGKGKGSRRGA